MSNEKGQGAPIALYIHIPFCETKCNYCNFNTYAKIGNLTKPYVRALGAEIGAWGAKLGRPVVQTVFFGGGTPSWLPAADIAATLNAARSAFDVQPDAEITAEANPGDITQGRVAAWRAMGINRVSMGVQSFDDTLLTLLSRRHTAAEAIESFQRLRDGGYDNLNIDLIYGLPHQSFATWQRTLEQALTLAPSHVSLYALTVEEGTPMWQDVQKGRLPTTDPDAAADMYEEAERAMGGAGYQHYEISNWALPGRECRHNLVYWRNGPFLGVGPGAHSYLDGTRFWDLNSPAEYIRRMGVGAGLEGAVPGIPVVEEQRVLNESERLSETIILQLRLDEGLDTRALGTAFPVTAIAPHLETLRRYAGLGLLSEDQGVFRLTARGRLLSNEVFVRLLPTDV